MRNDGERTSPGRPRIAAGLVVVAIVVVVGQLQTALRLVPQYRGLYRAFPFYVPESGKSVLQIVLTVSAVCLLGRVSLRAAPVELGFGAPLAPALLTGLGAAAVMAGGLAAAVPVKPPSDPLALLYLAGLSPLAEETLYRAFAVGALSRRCHAPKWIAVVVPALVFGLGHLERGTGWAENAGVFAITASGGLLCGWLYLRWRNNFWVPFAVHAAMNLSWELFDVGRSALGGWFPFALQAGAAAVAVLLSVRLAPPDR